MAVKTRLLLWGCVLTVAGVIALQFAWLADYYAAAGRQFRQEINLAFEDAVKKEFMLRCDTIEETVFNRVMDTSFFRITARWSAHFGRYIYRVSNSRDPHDLAEFSHDQLDFPIAGPDDARRALVARRFARTLREEDLERHIVFFRTQSLGNYVEARTRSLPFDTARLRPLYAAYLAERGIREPFRLQYSDLDSTFNQVRTGDRRYPYISKAYPTYIYDQSPGQYVRALFGPPRAYLFGKMIGLLAGSLLLSVLTALSLAYLLRTLSREKKLSAVKNDFINHLGHEFKTPLSTISGALEALEEFDALGDPARSLRYIRMARAETERLSGMVSTVLDLALYERSDFALTPAAVDVSALLRSFAERYGVHAELPVDATSPAGAPQPPAGAPLFLRADEWHLTRALDNLLDNAVKYSPAAPDITIHCSANGGFLVIAVTDNGYGIPASEQPLIWDKFYRAPATRATVKGQGLGLSYVRTVVEKHGGWVAVASDGEGKGSTFTVAFPL
ncbi:MAG TPA: HAMP domain-containing sensor histidine kinase [Dinghuibacter sp.]|uniref:sensor histidine kinase n=1 Tax=Dinghuibacter sp. TaxID=2024697 RepID=UPI002CC3D39D|nr:HAMP domain-containing sensor histidine kinase [Dinghuibacter sp.]HTJ13394.1 HAMP domain-containing sensor histidine kinase [Dinghuibacter sp.]